MGTTGQGEGPRVLIVDDEPETIVLLQALLEECGVKVIASAPGGSSAVVLAAELGPDVVLMDVRMPDMDGLEATRLIKTAHPDTQVILLTFYDDIVWSLGAEEAGAYCCLLKGSPPSMITDMVKRAWEYKTQGTDPVAFAT